MNFRFTFLIFSATVLTLVLKFSSADDKLYRILKVRPSASQGEIKRAYKNLVKQMHPDKNKNPDAEQKFMELQQAYEILSDPQKKANYDAYGTVDPQNQHNHAENFHDLFSQFSFGSFQFNMPSENSFFTKHKITNRY